MPAPRKPDPARSHALIIGASEYDDGKYQDEETIKRSAEDFASLISTDLMWDLPSGHVTTLAGRVTVDQAATAVAEATRGPQDGLFVYLCAHGRRWTDIPDQGLHFALSDSAWNRYFSHLPFAWIRSMLANTSAADTVLIIDSCFAADSFLGDPEPLELPSLPGVCTLVPTKYPVPADTLWRGSEYTAFSGALIEIIGSGIDSAAEYLTPDSMFPVLRERLLARSHPEPDMRARSNVVLCQNRAYQRVTNRLPLNELLIKLDGITPVDPAVYATAIEDACEVPGERGTASRLVSEFGEKRPAAETVELADLLRSRSVPALGDHADSVIERFYASRDGREITKLLHLLHRRDVDDVDADEVLRKLINNKRPAQITADVSAGLRSVHCPGCNSISRKLYDRMLDVWPESEQKQLLKVLH